MSTTDDSGPLRVGVLGQGRSGYDIHVRWLREDPAKFTIGAVADQLPERLAAGDEFGARTYADYRDLLAAEAGKLDIIVNSLPSYLHPTGTIAALNAGFHVISEKPLARSVSDADTVIAVAAANDRLLLPFQNSRFQPFFAKMREVIASGKLGRIVHIRSNWSGFGRRWDWQTIQEYWGGNLLNTGPHPVDQAIVLFGDAMPNVFCRMVSDNPFGDAENFCLVTLHGDQAPIIEICISSFQAYPMGDTYNVQGTLGGLTGGTGGLKWKYFDPETAPLHTFNGEWSDNRQYCQETLDWTAESWSQPASRIDNFGALSKGFYDNVYDIIVNGAERTITLDQVRRQIAVMEECHRQNPMRRLSRTFLD